MYSISGVWIFPIAKMLPKEYEFLFLEDGVAPVHFESGGGQSGGAVELETA